MKTLCISFLLFSAFLINLHVTNAQQQDTIFFEDFESGWGSWYADNGLWEVGVPVVGPENTYSGQNCAGTDLDAGYPQESSTRLITPWINLPAGHVHLKFWHYFQMADNDNGRVQITLNGVNWGNIINYSFYSSSTAWTQVCVDISSFANQSVRLAFFFNATDFWTSNGWYIDDVSIITGEEHFFNPEDFENGIGDWSANNGLWQVGIPEVGPATVHSGENCAGTHLSEGYPQNINTRLESPLIILEPIGGQQPELYFWHWFTLATADYGKVQISKSTGQWEDVPGFGGPYTGSNETWSQAYVPLSDYANQTIRIGFLFHAEDFWTSNGWYIDDIRIEGATVKIIEPAGQNPVASVILQQNSPNPFRDQTRISFDLQENEDHVTLSVFNTSGQQVRVLADRNYSRGNHSVIWDGCDDSGKRVAPGIYSFRLVTENHCNTIKTIML